MAVNGKNSETFAWTEVFLGNSSIKNRLLSSLAIDSGPGAYPGSSFLVCVQ